MIRKKTGAIVIIVMMMIMAIGVVTLQILRSTHVGSSFIKTMMDRERAKVLALSGIQIAMAQLLPEEKDNDEKEKDKQVAQAAGKPQNDQLEKKKQLLGVLLPNVNRWQEYTFEEKTEGINGSIRICITSEHGKININEAFDFEKQQFRKEYAAMLATLEINGKMPAGEMLKGLQEFLVQRKKKLDDVSELRDIKVLSTIPLTYTPPREPQHKKEKPEPNKNLAIQDIFTIWTPTATLDPILLSDALCAIWGLRRPRVQDDEALKDEYKKFISSFQDAWAQNWDQNWKYLEPIYQAKPQNLKNILPILTKQFEPRIYSVLSYGKFGDTEQQLLAIIKKIEVKDTEQQQDKQDVPQASSKVKETFKVIRLYWL